MQDYSDLLSLAFLDSDWNVVETICPDVRLKGFLYFLPAGDYQIMLEAPGEEGSGAVRWVMSGDGWVRIGEDIPLPDNTLFTYQEDCIYELPTDGLNKTARNQTESTGFFPVLFLLPPDGLPPFSFFSWRQIRPGHSGTEPAREQIAGKNICA